MDASNLYLNLAKSKDGSFSAYNTCFSEHYHSLKDGAMRESMYKHVLPSFYVWQSLQNQNHPPHKNLSEVQTSRQNICESSAQRLEILDICFGLGLNSFCATHFYAKQSFATHIISPELDKELIASLHHFPYQTSLQNISTHILRDIQKNIHARYKNVTLDIKIMDALELVENLGSCSIDIIYQDAFSVRKNPELWSEDYFAKIFRILSSNGVISTYSRAQSIAKIAKLSGFYIYECTKFPYIRPSRIFTKIPITCAKFPFHLSAI